MHNDPEKLSEWSKYAYGFSDKKPSWTYYVILALMGGFCIYSIFHVTLAN